MIPLLRDFELLLCCLSLRQIVRHQVCLEGTLQLRTVHYLRSHRRMLKLRRPVPKIHDWQVSDGMGRNLTLLQNLCSRCSLSKSSQYGEPPSQTAVMRRSQTAGYSSTENLRLDYMINRGLVSLVLDLPTPLKELLITPAPRIMDLSRQGSVIK